MSYAERFEAEFPRYLSIGMTAAEYWGGDCTLVKPYRQAQRLREEREDALAWLQGRYIYDALRMVSPLFHDFVKGTPKAEPYMEKPYWELEKERRKKETEERMRQNGLAFMLAYAEKFNKNFKAKRTGGERS